MSPTPCIIQQHQLHQHTCCLFCCVQSPVEAYLDQLLGEVKDDAIAAGFKARTSGWGELRKGSHPWTSGLGSYVTHFFAGGCNSAMGARFKARMSGRGKDNV